MDPSEIMAQVRDKNIHLVAFLYTDNNGVIRGKMSGTRGLERRLKSGIGLPVAMQVLNGLDFSQFAEGLGASGEVRLFPDLDTFTILPYAPGRAAMICDLVSPTLEPWALCTRSFLKNMISRANNLGLHLRVSLESEWMLARLVGEDYRPLDTSLHSSTVGMTTARLVIDEAVLALEAQGMEVEQYHPELGHGQQELSIHHTDILRAADNHVLYRETIRNVAWNHGLFASFAPKPFPNQAGNGCHIHFSVWDKEDDSNLFYHSTDRHGLSDLAYHFMAGVLGHLPGLVGLTCPSVNSYRRLQPQTWSSSYICYGPDNREAAIRIPSLFVGNEMGSTNLELKASDNSCNPYMALGGLLAAGLDGLEKRIAPNTNLMVEGDPHLLSQLERRRRGIKRLPNNLGTALMELRRNGVLMKAMGSSLANCYLAVRESEWEQFSAQDEDYELKQHFYRY
jgi:glutamine synthetase